MNIGDRVKIIRKSLDLNQTEFGSKIGLKQSSLGQIETGVRAVSDRVIKLICSTFNVDYFWLTTGEGQMFHESSNPVADRINDLLEGENETAKALFRAFAYCSEDDWNMLQKFMDRLIEARKGTKKDDP